MKIAAISFTEKGHMTAMRLSATATEHEVRLFAGIGGFENLAELTAAAWQSNDALVFICAAGIAVRAVAPLAARKSTDPAVLVIDELSRFVIPILSGHLGGANSLAAQLAERLGATAVITTATDINGIFAVDEWAARSNCAIANIGAVKHVSSALLRGEAVGFHSDFEFNGELPRGFCTREATKNKVIVSIHEGSANDENTLQIVPQIVTLGIGCRRGISAKAIRSFVFAVLCAANISPLAVECVASIDVKRDEAAILALAAELHAETRFFTAAELNSAKGGFTTSNFVAKTVGTGNVCERAAALASRGKLIIRKTMRDGITVAAAVRTWRVEF